MPWSYKCNPTLKIVEVVYSGKTTARDLQESTSEFIALEKEKGLNKFLIDTTEMELSATLVDIFNLPVNQYIEEGADRRGSVAVIQPTSPREKEAVQFYETVCENRGWKVQVFSNSQEAIKWLTRSAVSTKAHTGDGY